MQFYTRKKKPTLYNILILSAVTLAVLIIGIPLFGGKSLYGVSAAALIVAAYLAAVIVLLILALKGQFSYNPYSYNTIFYVGFILFLLSVLISHIVAVVRAFQDPLSYGLDEIAELLLHAPRQYLILTVPFLSAFAVGLIVSNISLIRHEARRLNNFLAIALGAIILLGTAGLLFLDRRAAGGLGVLLSIVFSVYLYFVCMLIGTIFADVMAAVHVPPPDRDYVIVLGCRVARDGTPTPLLRGRVDRAVSFAGWQMQRTGKPLTLIVSGGNGNDEPVSEAEAMRTYLISAGFSEDRIILEDRSRNTAENMLFSKALIPDPAASKVAFSTTNYHVFRSGIAANRAKLKAEGMGARTRWYFWPNASVREFMGLLSQHRGKQILIFTGMIAIYASLALVAR